MLLNALQSVMSWDNILAPTAGLTAVVLPLSVMIPVGVLTAELELLVKAAGSGLLAVPLGVDVDGLATEALK